MPDRGGQPVDAAASVWLGDRECVEPMAAITNGLNLAHKGIYKELQHVSPGGAWRESFWIAPRGFEAK